MTPEQHNKYLGISHLGFAGFLCLMMIMFLVFFGAMFGAISSDPHGPPLAMMFIMWLFIAVIYGGMTIPSFIAGYALLKRKRWAKTAAIIAGVFSAMSFPIGTAVCVYTFWFLFSEPGKILYDKPTYALPPGQQSWAASGINQPREHQYAPPQSPPDWR